MFLSRGLLGDNKLLNRKILCVVSQAVGVQAVGGQVLRVNAIVSFVKESRLLADDAESVGRTGLNFF
jgi:hypothetical protein